MTKQHTNASDSSAPQGDGAPETALKDMAILLAEGLSRHSIQDQWNDLDDGDRQSLMAVCEWLLMDWDLLVRARSERAAQV
jgi:hypothetical protein